MNGLNIYEKEHFFELENVSSLSIYTIEFTEYDITWKLVVERSGDDLNIFLEPLDDADRYIFYVAFSFIQSGRTLNKEYFREEQGIVAGERMGGKVLSWDNFINRPQLPFVVDDKTTLKIEMSLV